MCSLAADVPGLSEADLQVEVVDGTLLISGQRQLQHQPGAQLLRQERSTLKFSRAFALPEHVSLDGITARLQHGVLTVEVRAPSCHPGTPC
jgi:HSP20 family protein